LFSCNNNNANSGNFGKGKKTEANSPKQSVNNNVNFNVFIENSGSMDGYISQQSEFKDVLVDFASDIPTYFNSSPGFYFVNSNGPCDAFHKNQTQDFTKFISDLSPSNFRDDCQAGSNSSIDNIIDNCTKNMQDKVSIIFSDCILSYKNTGTGGAKSAQANIKMFMSRKINSESLSTIVIKFNSKFKGKYYNESDGKGGETVISTPINRPYYALIFGETKTLNYLLSKIDFKKYSGFESSYTLLSNNNSTSLKSSITYKNVIGSFPFVKPSEMKIVNAETKKGTNEFQFSINSSLSELPFENDYLTDITNYYVNENFKLKSVEPTDNTNGFSHTLTLTTNDLKQVSNLKIGLKYSIPNWVDNTGSDIDNNPFDSTQQKQTFGFKYLMSGIAESYIANNDSLQFKILLNISKGDVNEGGFSKYLKWIFIFLALLLCVFIYLKNKK
jgi:hypothetical protein